MKIIAHRGNKRHAPENTMAAFRSASMYPVDGIEFDLQFTKDKIPVVIHDSTIDRTTNGRGAVSSYTLSELQQFDAGVLFDETFFGERIPTFSEVLTWASHETFQLHVELKKQTTQENDFVKRCIEEIIEYDLLDRAVISSFYHPYLVEVKKLCPDLHTAFLTKVPILRAIKYAKKIEAEAIHIRHSYHAMRYYRRWAKKGLTVRAYNVHTIKEAFRCAARNVDAIITNDPKTMTDTFKKKQE
ncbi:glycerophosphodiester phosphodiesterase [Salipaludibacillus agaradhaerens]|uniref:Glycerophosphodiester phosphodiesterase n=1 Tax=Salipaludibacillus agaradhaerens TaxID=76935 RepID=A0A9Q4FZ45_SALAG|nr:glycerophosphodiester phosphodiesterase family protein [Salipaludibacillus agaradhaerens]MCR6096767.1 glycerophosphodiester phosphodiesterase [Salipaludibacillus agaradhaerens]MCR6113674.1 glycerophosphodiester phosphodiesterase [Salipaludibacillus agaradhaerens]